MIITFLSFFKPLEPDPKYFSEKKKAGFTTLDNIVHDGRKLAISERVLKICYMSLMAVWYSVSLSSIISTNALPASASF